MRGRIYSIILVLVMLVLVWSRGIAGLPEMKDAAEDEIKGAQQAAAEPGNGYRKLTLRLWYTDQRMTDFLQESAQRYMAKHEDIRLLPLLMPQSDFSDAIYRASVSEEKGDVPDLFITTEETLEKAYLSGIAEELDEEACAGWDEKYGIRAQNAVTYHGRKTAYPLFFETPLFFYNKTYLESMAQAHNQAAQDIAEGEAAMARTQEMLDAGADPAKTQAQEGEAPAAEYVPVTGEDLIPASFEEILNLANDYDAPEGMEAILKWDVTDIFYNYFFAGAYMQLGGECGDDASLVNLYNEKSVACMEVYSALKQFFSIEAKESDYDAMLQEFAEGKTLFTIAGPDAFARLEEAAAEGTFSWEYGVTLLPDLNEGLASRSLSMTGAVAVNGFGRHREQAADAAAFLSQDCTDLLLKRTEHLPACRNTSFLHSEICYEAYEKSIGLPKIMEASNFWMQLEMVMTGIWEGVNADESLMGLQKQMESQLSKK